MLKEMITREMLSFMFLPSLRAVRHIPGISLSNIQIVPFDWLGKGSSRRDKVSTNQKKIHLKVRSQQDKHFSNLGVQIDEADCLLTMVQPTPPGRYHLCASSEPLAVLVCKILR